MLSKAQLTLFQQLMKYGGYTAVSLAQQKEITSKLIKPTSFLKIKKRG